MRNRSARLIPDNELPEPARGRSSRVRFSSGFLFTRGERAGECEAGDFVLSHKHHARPALGVYEELLQYFGARWPAGNHGMCAKGHQAAATLSFRVEHLELILQIGCVLLAVVIAKLVGHQI